MVVQYTWWCSIHSGAVGGAVYMVVQYTWWCSIHGGAVYMVVQYT